MVEVDGLYPPPWELFAASVGSSKASMEAFTTFLENFTYFHSLLLTSMEIFME